MQSWMMLWKVVFLVGIGIFAVMAVWIAFAGGRDIKDLLGGMARARRNPRRKRGA